MPKGDNKNDDSEDAEFKGENIFSQLHRAATDFRNVSELDEDDIDMIKNYVRKFFLDFQHSA